MKVVYYLDLPTDEYLWWMRESSASVAKAMPGVEKVLLTHRTFPELNVGADTMCRHDLSMDGYFPHRKFLASSVMEGDCLFIDVDCIVRRDVRHIFDAQFDVAMCYRYGRKEAKLIPFNSGVIFSRSPVFMKEIAGSQSDHDSWRHSEEHVSKVAMSDKYVVRVLNGAHYNYSPDSETESVEGRGIVHYKGKRKEWMCPKTTPSS